MSVVMIPVDEKGNEAGQALVLRATLRENNSVDNTITTHPRENTTEVTDNIIRKPRIFTCSGIITDDPSGFLQGAIAQKIADIFTPDPISELPASKQMWDYITLLAYWQYPFIVGGALEVYTNMYIENCSASKSPRTFGGMEFSLTLREVLKATSATTESELEQKQKEPAPEIEDRAAPKEAQGKKKEKTTTEKERSIIADITAKLAGVE